MFFVSTASMSRVVADTVGLARAQHTNGVLGITESRIYYYIFNAFIFFFFCHLLLCLFAIQFFFIFQFVFFSHSAAALFVRVAASVRPENNRHNNNKKPVAFIHLSSFNWVCCEWRRSNPLAILLLGLYIMCRRHTVFWTWNRVNNNWKIKRFCLLGFECDGSVREGWCWMR